MNGKDECASFTELMLSQQVRDIGSKSLFQILLLTLNHHPVFNYLFIYLQEKVKLEEVERLRNQNKEVEAEAGRVRRGILVPCSSTIGSSKESQEKQSHRSHLLRMKRNFERQSAESLQSEFDRLWLLNERMHGRELEGMTSSDLALPSLKHIMCFGGFDGPNFRT
ncbi:unnamed protein product [Brassica oleracea var. botrytis]